jgi:hypothetical protein
MTEEDYREILQYARRKMNSFGLSSIDERIMSDLRSTEGPFEALLYYLKHLTEEVALGSDTHLDRVLMRLRRNTRTETDEPIEGVRLTISEQDRDQFGTDHIDFMPSSDLGQIREDLHALIDYLMEDRRRSRGGE